LTPSHIVMVSLSLGILCSLLEIAPIFLYCEV